MRIFTRRRWRLLAAALTAAVAAAAGIAVSPAAAAPGDPYKGLAGSDCNDYAKLNVTWYYNWWIDPGDCAAPGFVPMVSGKAGKTAGDVTWALDTLYGAGYRTVLGFNEPNKADQGNLTVGQALDLWPALTARPAVRVGSPATSGDGQAWFTDFMTQAAARGYRIDFITLHWYGWNAGSCDANASTFESYLRWAESLPGNKPIWITEYGCLNQSAPDGATVQRFLTGALAMFARHPRVERHSFYPSIANHELVSGSTLTPLGKIYAAAKSTQ